MDYLTGNHIFNKTAINSMYYSLNKNTCKQSVFNLLHLFSFYKNRRLTSKGQNVYRATKSKLKDMRV